MSRYIETYSDVEGGDGKLVLTSVVEDLVDVLSGDDTGGNNVKNTHSVVDTKKCEYMSVFSAQDSSSE